MPSIIIRGWNFTSAIARWASRGCPMRTPEQIRERLEICQACEHLVDDHCDLCGCKCCESNRLTNKLALATESCPLKKWA